MLILVTGATGKVGRTLIDRLLADPAWATPASAPSATTAPCRRGDRVEVVRGSIADRATVEAAMPGVTHVVHLATCKEMPELVMDVTVKGLFWLLEAFRASPTARRFVLIGGDAGVGHFHHRHDGPVTEATPHMAYPGCYALSKVLEEVMVAQFGIQYGLDWTCLRAPWIMEKDDFRLHPLLRRRRLRRPRLEDPGPARDRRPLPRRGHRAAPARRRRPPAQAQLRARRRPRRRHPASRSTTPAPPAGSTTSPWTSPSTTARSPTTSHATRGLPAIDIPSRFHSTWLDNTRARLELGWRPAYDLPRLVEAAWSYRRAPDDPRKVWYPG